jgi:hypothetical protein
LPILKEVIEILFQEGLIKVSNFLNLMMSWIAVIAEPQKHIAGGISTLS